jgi:serine/threonine protein kinase
MHVVWRDPKPGNIIVTPEGRVVILDFGISRQLSLASTDTQVGMILGTPGYMSPEQIRGEPVDVRSDIYGLGATYFEIVTGRRAYVGSDVAEIRRDIISLPPPMPSVVNSAARVFDDVIGRCLAKTPGDRPSAKELCSSLETGAAAAAALGRYVVGLQELSARRNEDSTDVQWERRTVGPRVPPPPTLLPSPAPRSTPRPITEAGLAAPIPASGEAVGMVGPRIEVVDGGRVISIVDPEVRIGRSTDNDIVVDDKAVSRYACVIMRGETVIGATGQHTYYLRELNTANGILLNGQRVSTVAELHDNDLVTLGTTQLRFRVR